MTTLSFWAELVPKNSSKDTQRIRSRSVGPSCFGGQGEISGPSAFPTIEQTVKAVSTWRCDGILGCG